MTNIHPGLLRDNDQFAADCLYCGKHHRLTLAFGGVCGRTCGIRLQARSKERARLTAILRMTADVIDTVMENSEAVEPGAAWMLREVAHGIEDA